MFLARTVHTARKCGSTESSPFFPHPLICDVTHQRSYIERGAYEIEFGDTYLHVLCEAYLYVTITNMVTAGNFEIVLVSFHVVKNFTSGLLLCLEILYRRILMFEEGWHRRHKSSFQKIVCLQRIDAFAKRL